MRLPYALAGALLLVPAMAWADTAPASDQVALAPWVAIIKPYADLLVQTVLIPVLVGVITTLIYRYTGVKTTQANVERLKSAAATEAGAAIAEAADGLKGRSITIDSSIVRSGVEAVQDRLPGLIQTTGVTPEVLGKFVQGEIGKLQATQAAVDPVVAVPPITGKPQ